MIWSALLDVQYLQIVLVPVGLEIRHYAFSDRSFGELLPREKAGALGWGRLLLEHLALRMQRTPAYLVSVVAQGWNAIHHPSSLVRSHRPRAFTNFWHRKGLSFSFLIWHHLIFSQERQSNSLPTQIMGICPRKMAWLISPQLPKDKACLRVLSDLVIF